MLSVTALWLSTSTLTPTTQLISNLSQFDLTFCGNFDIKLFKVGDLSIDKKGGSQKLFFPNIYNGGCPFIVH